MDSMFRYQQEPVPQGVNIAYGVDEIQAKVVRLSCVARKKLHFDIGKCSIVGRALLDIKGTQSDIKDNSS
jgi:hypothetical protein